MIIRKFTPFVESKKMAPSTLDPKPVEPMFREFWNRFIVFLNFAVSKIFSVDPEGKPLTGAKVAVKVGGSTAKRPCLDYHIKRCTGPCAGMVTPEEYRKQVDEAIQFLSGDYKVAIGSLKKQMMDFANDKKFERAAAMRDQIGAIERLEEKQIITDTNLTDRDVIAYVEDLGKNYFVLFQIRGGKLIDQEKFVSEGGEDSAEAMEAFLRDYYGYAADIPKEVIISIEVKVRKLIEDYIRTQTDHAVNLIYPIKGERDQLIQLAEKNARSYAEQSRVRWMVDEKKGEKALEDLQRALKLPDLPKRIECYDISHLGGTETVGSMVVFLKGEANKAHYRQFRLRSTVDTIDDFKSMEEVLSRRLNYLPTELPEGYEIKKAIKKDFDFIKKTCENPKIFINDEDLDVKQFYTLKKGKTIVGFCRTRPFDEKIHEISSLWVSEKERGNKFGHHLMKKCIEGSKLKRLYGTTHKDLKDYYLMMGFEELREAPKLIQEKINRLKKDYGMDPKKIVTLAYQKKKKDISFTAKPDLIVIDGGKGQLHSAHDAMFNKGLNIPMISLAKKEEEVFVPGKSEPINLPKNSEASYLLQRIRDEAHRLAIEHNRSSRDKKMVKSALDDIPGVGPKMKKKLLTYFGSVHKIREANQVQLEQIVGEGIARKIKEGL